MHGDDTTEYLGSKSVHQWKWSAPENFQYPQYCIKDGSIICPKPIYTSKSDVWSFGITLWEISTTGDEPYDDLNEVDTIPKIVDDNFRLEIPPTENPKLRDLMQKCWTFELPVWIDETHLVHQLQGSRPSFNEIWITYFGLTQYERVPYKIAK